MQCISGTTCERVGCFSEQLSLVASSTHFNTDVTAAIRRYSVDDKLSIVSCSDKSKEIAGRSFRSLTIISYSLFHRVGTS